MKFTNLATAFRKSATLSAAAAAGFAAGVSSGPGDVGIQDEVQTLLIKGPPAAVATVEDDLAVEVHRGAESAPPAPVVTATPSEPQAGCRHEILIQRPTDLVSFLGDPASGYVLVEPGRAAIPLPPGAVDARLAALEGRYHKAGTQDLYANVEIALYDPSGAMKDFRALPNLIVNAGRNLGIKMLIGDNTGSCPSVPCGNSGACANPAKFNYIGIGADGTAEGASQTALISEFTIGANYARQLDNAPDFPGTAGQAKLITTFGADNPNGGGTLLESGVFNASSGGTMLARRVFSSISKGDQDTLQITWTFTLS